MRHEAVSARIPKQISVPCAGLPLHCKNRAQKLCSPKLAEAVHELRDLARLQPSGAGWRTVIAAGWSVLDAWPNDMSCKLSPSRSMSDRGGAGKGAENWLFRTRTCARSGPEKMRGWNTATEDPRSSAHQFGKLNWFAPDKLQRTIMVLWSSSQQT